MAPTVTEQALVDKFEATGSDLGAFWDMLSALSEDEWALLATLVDEDEINFYKDFINGERPESDTSSEEPFSEVGTLVEESDLIPAVQEDYGMQVFARAFRAMPKKYTVAYDFTKPVEGLLLNKSATDMRGDGSKFQIDLKAEAESNIVVTSAPCDIILVLDTSSSMAGDRIKSLKSAAKNFIDTVNKNSPTSRIGLVAYGSDVKSHTDLTQVSTGATFLKNTIQSYGTSGGTYSDAGLEKATKMFQAIQSNDSNYNNTRAVILFTDGVPGDGSWDDWWFNSYSAEHTAQDSIQWSKILKGAKGSTVTINTNEGFYGKHGNDSFNNTTGCGAKVYTVGLNLPARDVKINEYMYRVSSNREDGSHVSEWGNGGYSDARTRNQPPYYYLTTDNLDELDKIFQKIAQQTGKTIEDATIRDYIPAYLQLIDSNGNVLDTGDTVYDDAGHPGTVKYDSEKNSYYVEWTKITLDPGEIDTSGEKFSASIYVKPADDFFGGATVPTNLGGVSAVYNGEDDSCIGSFEVPTVNIPIQYEIAAQDQTIYLGNKAKLADLMGYADKGSASEYYKPNGTNNAYVDITYTLKQGNKTVATMVIPAGAASGTWSNPTAMEPALSDCTGYTLGCTVSPASPGSVSDKVCDTEKATVHVMMPKFKIQANDVWADFSTAVDLSKWALGGAGQAGEITGYKPSFEAGQWVDANKHQTVTVDGAIGTAPTLDDMSDFTFTFTKKAAPNGDGSLSGLVCMTGEKDTDFKVALAKYKIHGTEFTVPAGTDPIYIQVAYPDNGDHFTVHTNRFDLTVTKTHDTPPEYGAQTFAFQLTGDSGLSVPFALGDKLGLNKTFKGLLCGKAYTVAEDGAWAWRYGTPGSKNVPAVTNETSRTAPTIADKNLEFHNAFNNHKWLSDGDSKSNVFGSKG